MKNEITQEQIYRELGQCIQAKEHLNALYFALLKAGWQQLGKKYDFYGEEETKERKRFEEMSLGNKRDAIEYIIGNNSSEKILRDIKLAKEELQKLKLEQEQYFMDREKQVLDAMAKVKQYEADMSAKLIKKLNE